MKFKIPTMLLSNPSSQSSTSPYLASLDGLRAIAILTVMSSHLLSSKLFPGQFGVTLFFFISGFIITRNMLEKDFAASELGFFYLRRFFRLMPAVLMYVSLTYWTARLLGGQIPIEDVSATIFYYANYHGFSKSVVPGVGLSPLEMTWSLAVEEHFYLIFPLVLLATSNAFRLFWTLLAMVAGALAWRIWLIFHGASEWDLYVHTDTRFDSILYGCILSTAFHVSKSSHRGSRIIRRLSGMPFVLLGFGLLLLSFAIRDPLFRSAARYFLQGLALMPIFCASFYSSPSSPMMSKVLSLPGLTYIGKLSYSLYLYHILCWFVLLTMHLSHTMTAVLTIIFSFIAAFLSYTLIEQPGRKWGGRLISAVRARRLANAVG